MTGSFGLISDKEPAVRPVAAKDCLQRKVDSLIYVPRLRPAEPVRLSRLRMNQLFLSANVLYTKDPNVEVDPKVEACRV